MFSKLDQKHELALDALINKNCQNPKNYGELKQLSNLFTLDFGEALLDTLNSSLQLEANPSICDVQIGWIDKIPLAKTSLSKRTEIGDVFLTASEHKFNRQGTRETSSKALILQPKIAKSADQLINPRVPIAPNRLSTKKELELLSSWPKFDLYETSRSNNSCITDVVLDTTKRKSPYPYAYYIVAPGKRYQTPDPKWRCWWLAGPTLKDEPCETTLGTLFVKFLKSSPESELGVDFTRQFPPYPARTDDNQWSLLCSKILEILESRPAPKNIFGQNRSRLQTILRLIPDVINKYTIDEIQFPYDVAFFMHLRDLIHVFRNSNFFYAKNNISLIIKLISALIKTLPPNSRHIFFNNMIDTSSPFYFDMNQNRDISRPKILLGRKRRFCVVSVTKITFSES